MRKVNPSEVIIRFIIDSGMEIEIYDKNSIPIEYNIDGIIRITDDIIMTASYFNFEEIKHTAYVTESIITNFRKYIIAKNAPILMLNGKPLKNSRLLIGALNSEREY